MVIDVDRPKSAVFSLTVWALDPLYSGQQTQVWTPRGGKWIVLSLSSNAHWQDMVHLQKNTHWAASFKKIIKNNKKTGISAMSPVLRPLTHHPEVIGHNSWKCWTHPLAHTQMAWPPPTVASTQRKYCDSLLSLENTGGKKNVDM